MKFLKYSVVALFLLLASRLFAAEQLPLAVHLDIESLTRASAPKVVDNYLLFTFQPRAPARFVGIAFGSQDFRTVHSFYRNKHGVFFYLLPISGSDPTIVYRLVVDGLWRSDPENPDRVIDPSGIVLSKVAIPPQNIAVTTSPVVQSNGTVKFFFKAPPHQTVTIAGDFNSWDPFMNPLAYTKNGFYTVTLRIAPGTHGYYFVSNGTPIADPLDPLVDHTSDGTKISVFTVP